MADNPIVTKVFWHSTNDETCKPVVGKEYLVFFEDSYRAGFEWCFGVGRARNSAKGVWFDCFITPKNLSIKQPSHWGVFEAPINEESEG